MAERLLLLLSFAACTDRPVGGDTDATSTGGTSTSAAGTTTGAPPTTNAGTGSTGAPADCLELDYEVDDPSSPQWMLTCGLPDLCPGDDPLVFQLGTGAIHDPQTVEVEDLDRARCMATALRDRTLGQIRWWSEEAGREYSLEILGDQTLARGIETITELIDGFDAHEGLRALQPSGFFADCADGDAMQVWLCLVDAFEPECLPGPLACPN